MKKFLSFFFIATALMACSSGGKMDSVSEERAVEASAVEANATDNTALEQRVKEIYDVALGQYEEKETDGAVVEEPNVDSLYCSQDWNSWVSKVKDHDAKLKDGMMGFFDADYWIMGQDWMDLSISDVHVVEMNEATATVELKLHNCGNVIPVQLNMVLEDGVWKIDNFVDAAKNLNWKASMKEYMKGR